MYVLIDMYVLIQTPKLGKLAQPTGAIARAAARLAGAATSSLVESSSPDQVLLLCPPFVVSHPPELLQLPISWGVQNIIFPLLLACSLGFILILSRHALLVSSNS